MDQITVNVRPDGKTYQQVTINEIDSETDFNCMAKSIVRTLNQKSMQYDESYDAHLLRYLRLEASTSLSLAQLKKMPSKDVRIMLNAWDQLNSLTEDEKSIPPRKSAEQEGTRRENKPENEQVPITN